MDLNLLLQRAASSAFADYSPEHLVAAVNALLPLGKSRALDAIERYLADADLEADPQQGLLLVLRVLFEVPTALGYHPPLRIGASMPAPPRAPEALPHFPIVLIDDVPLLMVSGYALGGDAEAVTSHLEHFRRDGQLRNRQLEPVRSPEGLLEKYKGIYWRAYGLDPSARELGFIQDQLNRLR